MSVIVLAATWAVGACRPAPRETYELRLSHTPGPALHAVHSQRLKEVMAEMQYLLADRLPQELNADQRRTERARELAKVAGAMADDARRIPDALSGVRMSADYADLFREYAASLEHQARELHDAAAAGRLDKISAQMDGLQAACDACHNAFRVLPVASAAPLPRPGRRWEPTKGEKSLEDLLRLGDG
jgi:cytochrome c556